MNRADDRYLVASLEFEGVLRACLHRYARNAADVDALMQETWTHLLAAGSRPREEMSSIRAFALNVARNVAQSWLLHRRVVPIEHVADLNQLELLEERRQSDEIAKSQQELAQLTQAVARLPARCRQVFTLRKVYGLSQQEIAAQLGISGEAVEHQLAKGTRLCGAGFDASPVSEQRALIEEQASRWLAAYDARTPTAEDAATFDAWILANIGHRIAWLRIEATWKRFERLREVRPLDRDVDRDLLRAPRRHWSVALSATLLVLLLGTAAWFTHAYFGWQHYETRIGGFSRIVLEDGSVIDLNTNSEVRVRIGSGRREVRLLRGEGRFQVAHDAAHPFVVTAAGADVRAIGTAFSVRLRNPRQLDVLVSEGSVDIASPRVGHAPPIEAGESAILRAGRVSVRRVEPQIIARRLAWTSGQIQFHGETLREAVAEFNRYNRRQLRVSETSLDELRVTGTFNATDPDSFAAALTSRFHVRVDIDMP